MDRITQIIKLTAVVALFLLLQTSCRRHKLKKSEVFEKKPVSQVDSTEIQVEEAPAPIIEEETPKLTVLPSEINFNYLKIKSKVDFSSPNITQSFPATIHVKKDSVIWVSVTVGLEAARGIITPDSAIFLDRLNKNVYRFSFNELKNLFGFDITYSLVQSLIVGNMPIYVRKEDEVSSNGGGFITVKQQDGTLNLENAIDALTNKLKRVVATTNKNPSNLVITYDDFVDQTEGKIPHKISTYIEAQQDGKTQNTTVIIEHNKLEFLDKDLRFPFNVPKTYTEVTLKK